MTSALLAPVAPAAPIAGINSIVIRQSVESDNAALLALTRLTPMDGKISIRIDHDPDFFALGRARGETVTFVATSGETIVGCISASMYPAYIDGVLERVVHANDLKVHPLFTGRHLARDLIAAAETYIRAERIDLCFTLVADGNRRVMAIADACTGSTAPRMMGRFLVDQIVPLPLQRKRGRYRAEAVRIEDLPEIAAVLDRQNQSKNFAPPVHVTDLRSWVERHPEARFRELLLVRDAGVIVATLGIEDTQNLRQNILIGLPRGPRLALGGLRLFTYPLRNLDVPRRGDPLNILYTRHLYCAEGHEQALRMLIAEARREAYRHRFHFLSVGLHERDPLRFCVQGLPRLTFTSCSIAASLSSPGRVHSLADRIPFEDFALV